MKNRKYDAFLTIPPDPALFFSHVNGYQFSIVKGQANFSDFVILHQSRSLDFRHLSKIAADNLTRR
jgi:hypothetical protein